jgi:hypothetical protein
VALVALALGVLDPAGIGGASVRSAQVLHKKTLDSTAWASLLPDMRLPMSCPLVLSHANLRHTGE